MKVPFTYESVEELVGKKLVVSKNMLGDNVFWMEAEVVLSENGEAGEGEVAWLVEDGALRIDMGSKGGWYEFNGAEAANGVVRATGMHSVDHGTRRRSVLHLKAPVGDDFGICVSSNRDYEKETLPVLAASLEKAGFDKDRVLVVVGGCKDEDEGSAYEAEGFSVVRRKAGAMGFTALGDAAGTQGMRYWMLLHDTCTVEPDFAEKAAALDVGLGPDVVLFMGTDSELGLYSVRHLAKGAFDVEDRPSSILSSLMDSAKVVVNAAVKVTTEPERDIYGGGVMRKVMKMGTLGLVKTARGSGRRRKRP